MGGEPFSLTRETVVPGTGMESPIVCLLLVPRGRVSPGRLYDRAGKPKPRHPAQISGRDASGSKKVTGRPWRAGSSRK